MRWPGDGDGQIDARERRVVKNDALFRQVNERIELTRGEYEGVREVADRFAIKPGHAHIDFERVAETFDRYEVIEKTGESERVARQTDPRS